MLFLFFHIALGISSQLPSSSCGISNTDFRISGDNIDIPRVLLLEGEMMYLGGTSFSTGMTHGRSDMVVYAIEKTTPKVIWSVYLGGTSTEETLHAMASNGTQLYVSGSTVLGAFETTIFSTLDKSNGNLVWTKKLGNTETVVVKKIGMMGDLVFGVGFSV